MPSLRSSSLRELNTCTSWRNYHETQGTTRAAKEVQSLARRTSQLSPLQNQKRKQPVSVYQVWCSEIIESEAWSWENLDKTSRAQIEPFFTTRIWSSPLTYEPPMNWFRCRIPSQHESVNQTIQRKNVQEPVWHLFLLEASHWFDPVSGSALALAFAVWVVSVTAIQTKSNWDRPFERDRYSTPGGL